MLGAKVFWSVCRAWDDQLLLQAEGYLVASIRYTPSTKAITMSSISGRILHSNSKPLLVVVSIVVTAIALVSFAMSAPALVELAIMANIDSSVAWGWFVIVDGTIVVATLGTVVLHSRSSGWTRGYPWFILIVFGALSVYANGVHAIGGQISPATAFIIGAVAPIALLTSTHLLVVMLSSPQEELTDEQLVKLAAKDKTRTELATTSIPDAAAAPEGRQRKSTGRGSSSSDREYAAIHIVNFRDVNGGQWPTGAMVGRWIQKSPKTGLRILNEIKNKEEQGSPGSAVA